MVIQLGNMNEGRKYLIPLYLTLIAAGLVGNYFKFTILNADFIFGSIFAMLALQFLGFGRGVLAAAIIASYTYIAWNHPYAMITMTAEVAVVGYLFYRKKISVLMADTLYWLLVGIPLGYFCFNFIADLPASNSIFLMTKQAINGIANALVARLIFTGYALRSKSSLISLREILSNLLAFFVICTALIMLGVASSSDFAEIDHRIRSSLIQDSRRIAENLENWVENRKLPIVNLARMAETLSPAQMQPRLEQLRKGDFNFLRIVLLNKESLSTAHSPPVDELGRSAIGLSYADRPFIPTLKSTLKPMLSEVVLSKIERHAPIAIMIAPVLAHREYNGCVSGILNFDRIQAILKVNTDGTSLLYSLLDKNGNVIVSSRKDQKIMTPFSRSKGTMNRPESGLSQWVPVLPTNTSTIALWGKSLYVAESPIGNMAEWKLVLEQPVEPFQKMLYDRYTVRFIMVFILLVVAMAIAEMLSRLVAASNEQLSNLTRNLPVRLASGATIQWPESGIQDSSNLIVNFRGMADALSARFNEIRNLNESLEERVEERTRQLSTSQQRLSLATKAGQVGIWDWDVVNDGLIWDDSMYSLYGISKDDFGGAYEAWSGTLHPDDRQFAEGEIQAALRGEREYALEFRIVQPDGAVRIIKAVSQTLRDQDGNALRMIGTNIDITEIKRGEVDKAKLENQLFQSQKMEAIGTLAGGIAHDFNNILAIINGYTEMAMNEDSKEIWQQHLQEALRGVERAKNLVKQILTFSRQDDHEKRPLDIKVLLKEAIKFLRASIPTTIEISQQITEKDCTIMADPTQMHQVIMNLCTNASHAMKETGGTLKVDLTNIELGKDEIPNHPELQQGHYVKLSVSDTGHGIDPAIVQRVFEPFFTTKSVDEGTGLGLSVVYGIVKGHGGVINVYSEPGKGAAFHVYLPLIIQAETKEVDAGKSVIGGTERILFVDDEPLLVDIGMRMLSTLGYQVTGAASSKEALDIFRTDPQCFDLVITDMTLPKMTGIDLSREILKIRPDIPIILCSGIREASIEEQAKTMGIKAYHTKPLTRRELSLVVRDTLDSQKKQVV